ncbi:hypothetical protein [uncultured Acetobacteroides sp.]|uniref:hypothetical protein n=1 Tax=uncultured Acetobacteroides sp. TaxID=1760811 RepID=UPI0029F5A89C|nr:hypothetical protein [uncultured Acetobacteroides sp.]
MNKIELVISHSTVKDNDLIPFTENVLQNLTGNSLFTLTKERIDGVRTCLVDYQAKLARSKDGSKQDTLLKNASKGILTSLLDDLALDLCIQASGDRDKLATSGFKLVKEPERKSKQPSRPVGFKVEHGTCEGELIFSVAASKDVSVYIFYFTPSPAQHSDATMWRSAVSTTRKITVTGFTHGIEYECRCAYQGSDHKPIFGDTIRILAL